MTLPNYQIVSMARGEFTGAFCAASGVWRGRNENNAWATLARAGKWHSRRDRDD